MANDESNPTHGQITESQRAFKEAPTELRDLVKRVLQEERKVMHMRRRSEIHATVLELVKKVVQ
jgi:hypothetical protein